MRWTVPSRERRYYHTRCQRLGWTAARLGLAGAVLHAFPVLGGMSSWAVCGLLAAALMALLSLAQTARQWHALVREDLFDRQRPTPPALRRAAELLAHLPVGTDGNDFQLGNAALTAVHAQLRAEGLPANLHILDIGCGLVAVLECDGKILRATGEDHLEIEVGPPVLAWNPGPPLRSMRCTTPGLEAYWAADTAVMAATLRAALLAQATPTPLACLPCRRL